MAGKAFNLTKGVLSFNGRKGSVIPLDGDYTAEMVGAADKKLSNLSNTQAALSALGAGVRPNGVLNPYALINQAGQSSYSNPTGSTVYAFDGRKGRLYDVSLADGVETISIEGASTGAARYGAVVPQGVNAGKTYTASAFVKATSVTGGPYFMCSNRLTNIGTASYVPQPSEKYVVLSTTFTAASDGSSVLLEFVAPNGSALTADVCGWKVEEGPNQTLAYQDSDGNWHLLPQPGYDYATQLLMCQQYQIPLSSDLVIPTTVIQPNYIDFFIPTPIQMRIAPVIQTATFAINDNASGTVYSDFSCAIVGSFSNGVAMRATKASHGITSAGAFVNTAGMLNANL